MPNRKSFWTNAWESALAAEFASGATTMTVADGSALPPGEFYLVIEPQDTGQREYVWVGPNGRTDNVITVAERNLAGSAGDRTHPNGSTVRTVALAQGFTDLHDRIDAANTALGLHEVAPDPHPQYLQLGGGEMTGALTLAGDAVGDLEPTTKQQVAADVATRAPLSHTHGVDDLPPLDYLPIDGSSPMVGNIDVGGNNVFNVQLVDTAGLYVADDPTTAGGVGNRGYNDGRYAALSHNHSAGDITSGTISTSRLPKGDTTGAYGIVRLTNSVSSTSTTYAATAKAVRDAYNKGNHSHPYISSSTPRNTVGNSFAAHRIRNIWIGASTPSSSQRQTGDLWFDTSG